MHQVSVDARFSIARGLHVAKADHLLCSCSNITSGNCHMYKGPNAKALR